MHALSVASYNIHKGSSRSFNRRLTIHELRDQLRTLDADIIFLQEVQGSTTATRRATRLARRAAVRISGARGVERLRLRTQRGLRRTGITATRSSAATRSCAPRTRTSRRTTWRAEGCCIVRSTFPGWREPLHCVCVHLALHERERRHQVGALLERIQREGAGRCASRRRRRLQRLAQFRRQAARRGARPARGARADHWGRPARTFPSAFPLLRLDRIYVRGFQVDRTETHRGRAWARLSDHAALSAHLHLD